MHIGAKLGAYEVIAQLGEGGMGEVYRARATRLGRDGVGPGGRWQVSTTGGLLPRWRRGSSGSRRTS
jgi:hypothetical protein